MKLKELYKFVEGSNVWTYTSGDATENYLGEDFTPLAIGRSETESKNEISKSNIEISVSIDSVLGQRYMNTVVDANVTLTIWSKQDADYLVAWKGRLASVKPNDATVKLIFESIFTSMRRPGIRRRFQISCGHVLYGRGCKLNKDDFDTAGTATAIDTTGTVVTVGAASSQPDGWYTGGMLRAPDGTLRFIVNHVGSSLTLIRQIESLTIAMAGGSQSVVIYPGCDRSRETCNSKFNNLPNNGAFPFIPTRNPFGTSVA